MSAQRIYVFFFSFPGYWTYIYGINGRKTLLTPCYESPAFFLGRYSDSHPRYENVFKVDAREVEANLRRNNCHAGETRSWRLQFEVATALTSAYNCFDLRRTAPMRPQFPFGLSYYYPCLNTNTHELTALCMLDDYSKFTHI